MLGVVRLQSSARLDLGLVNKRSKFMKFLRAKIFFQGKSIGYEVTSLYQFLLSKVHTPLLTIRDWHQHDGDQFHLFLVLLGALGWSRLVAPLGPSNFFQSLYHRGDHMKIQEVSQQP